MENSAHWAGLVFKTVDLSSKEIGLGEFPLKKKVGRRLGIRLMIKKGDDIQHD